MNKRNGLFTIALLTATVVSTTASAHPGGSAATGFLHPFTGLDHVLAMLAVGLWAGLASRATRVAVPAAFAVAMIAGAVLTIGGVAIPAVESGIAVSVVIFGLLAVTALKLGPAAGAILVGTFALFHGAAHGTEIGGATALTYIAGFAAASVVLQLAGVGLATALRRAKAELVVRMAGGATAVAGVVLALA